MISIDTNVLVRYVVEQAKKAARIINSLSPDQQAYVPEIVLIELTWVLERKYKYDRIDIIELLKRLLATEQFLIENAPVLQTALYRYEKSKRVQFADAIIAVKCEAINAPPIYSFDKNARNLGMKLP